MHLFVSYYSHHTTKENPMLIGLFVFLGLIVILFIAVVGMYNGLVTLRNRYKNQFAQIDVQLKRRYDLIPNLVETAKGYMQHERETLDFDDLGAHEGM